MTEVYIPPARTIGEVVHRETGAHIGWIVASDQAEVYRIQASYNLRDGHSLGITLKDTTELVEGQLVAVLAIVKDGPGDTP